MQVALAVPHSPLGGERSGIPQDCFLPYRFGNLMSDSPASSLPMAKLLVEQQWHCSQTILPADAAAGVEPVSVDQDSHPLLPSVSLAPRTVIDSSEDGRAPAVAAAEAAPALIENIEVVTLRGGQFVNCDEIIPNLYLGGMEAAEDTQSLIEQGICAVVCCNRELEFPSSKFSPGLEYYRVDVEDMGREPIELFFPEATEFIHSHLLRERPVLVHCKAGVSRSSSVVIAYLIEYLGYSLYDAFFLTLRHRPTITPNLGFMDKLRGYEEEKLGAATICIDKYMSWFQSRERTAAPDLKIGD